MLYVCVRDVMDVVFYVCIVRHGAEEIVYGSVSSCGCMFVSYVHTVAVLNAAFCMTYSLLMLVNDARGDHMAPYNTAYKWWSCQSGFSRLLFKLCRYLPPPARLIIKEGDVETSRSDNNTQTRLEFRYLPKTNTP